MPNKKHDPAAASADQLLSDPESESRAEETKDVLDPSTLASPVSSSANLLKTIIGSGMLALPLGFATVGWLPGTSMLFLAAGMSGYGLHLLALCGDRYGREASFAALAAITYPKLAILFDAAIFIKCIGVSISYLLVIGKMCTRIMEAFEKNSGILSRTQFWATLASLVVLPFALMAKMDMLKYTSALGLVGVAYLIVLGVVDLAIKRGSLGLHFRLAVPLSLKWMEPFSIFVFAFTCHQNLLPIQNEAVKNSSSAMDRIVGFCMSTTFVLYTFFAMSMYAIYSTTLQSPVINNFPSTGAQYIVARLLYTALLLCSIPLQTFPARASLERIIHGFLSEERKRRWEGVIFYSLSVGLVLLSWAVALTDAQLKKPLAVVGSTAGPVICYFLPALLWLKLPTEEKKSRASIIGSCVLMALGTVTTVISLIAVVLIFMNK